MTPETRLSLLENDVAEVKDEIKNVKNEIKELRIAMDHSIGKMTTWLIGILVSTTTAAIFLAINTLTGSFGEGR